MSGNVIVYGGHKPIQGDECRPRRRSLSMTRSYPEPLRVTGPLLSLVLRTEDVWQRYNHFRSVRGSQSGFPLLTPIMETDDGPARRLISTFGVQTQAPRCSRPSGQLRNAKSAFFWDLEINKYTVKSAVQLKNCTRTPPEGRPTANHN